MTTHDLTLIWQFATVAGALIAIWYIRFRCARERRVLHWAIVIGWVATSYIWDITINFVGQVEYSDHWYMAWSFKGKAEPALVPLIYVAWFVFPAVYALENRERLTRALGRHTGWWIWFGFAVWSFYLDFAATSLRPVWTYFQRFPFTLEYPMTAAFVNGFLVWAAYLMFRKMDDVRAKRPMGLAPLSGLTFLAANVTYGVLALVILVSVRMPNMQNVLLPYVKSQ